jgi:hypothetical protein
LNLRFVPGENPLAGNLLFDIKQRVSLASSHNSIAFCSLGDGEDHRRLPLSVRTVCELEPAAREGARKGALGDDAILFGKWRD